METNKNILNELKKSRRPDVPENFFESFADRMLDKVLEEPLFVDQLTKRNKPEIPDGFFDSFKEKMKQEETPQKETRIFSLRVWATVTSIAACLAVILWINSNEETSGDLAIDTNTTETEMSEEEFDAYLTYVDEGEIIDFIVESDLNLTEDESAVNEELYDFVGDDIEELYLEL